MARVCKTYHHAKLRFDRSQAEQLVQGLARRGIRTDEFVFSQSGANRLAKAIYTALRDRAIEVPDDPELVSELQTARMIETGPGTVKLQNPAGTHDDLAVAVGMVIVELTERLDGLPATFGGAAFARQTLLPPAVIPKAQIRDGAKPLGHPAPTAKPVDLDAAKWAELIRIRRGA